MRLDRVMGRVTERASMRVGACTACKPPPLPSVVLWTPLQCTAAESVEMSDACYEIAVVHGRFLPYWCVRCGAMDRKRPRRPDP